MHSFITLIITQRVAEPGPFPVKEPGQHLDPAPVEFYGVSAMVATAEEEREPELRGLFRPATGVDKIRCLKG